MKKILIVDDEPRTREGVRKVLEGWSSGRHAIEIVANGVEAMAWFEKHEANVVITDIRMPQISGLELVEKLINMPHPPIVIVISGHAEFAYAQQALKFGVVEYLLKPLDKHKLIQAVEQALAQDEERHRIDRMGKLVDEKLLETVQSDNLYSEPVQEAIDYVDQHLDGVLQLKDIADMLHLNSSYFSVLFKEQLGITFTEYVTRRRIQRAKDLLSHTRMTVAEIAVAVGYQTDKYFVRVFRNLEGMSPGQYRKHISEPGDLIP